MVGADSMQFGRMVKVWRERRGLTQDRLGRMVGYPGGTMISMIEGGKKRISLERALLIANVLGTSVDEMMGYAQPQVVHHHTTGATFFNSQGDMTFWNRMHPGDMKDLILAVVSAGRDLGLDHTQVEAFVSHILQVLHRQWSSQMTNEADDLLRQFQGQPQPGDKDGK